MNKLLIFIGILFTLNANGQGERKFVRSGNKLYTEKKYTEAEIDYRKAVDKKANSIEAGFNIGNALYKQNKYEEAAKQYQSLLEMTKDPKKYSEIFYNLGNSYFKLNKLDESANAYKMALRNNPNDAQSKYNLSLVQKMMRQQQQEKDKNKDGKDQEASEFAKKLKKQAEALVLQKKYREAYNLMKEGEKKDKTVATFSDFTNRILDVIKIGIE